MLIRLLCLSFSKMPTHPSPLTISLLGLLFELSHLSISLFVCVWFVSFFLYVVYAHIWGGGGHGPVLTWRPEEGFRCPALMAYSYILLFPCCYGFYQKALCLIYEKQMIFLYPLGCS